MTFLARESKQLSIRQKKGGLRRCNNRGACFFQIVAILFLLIIIGVISTVSVAAAEKRSVFREFSIASVWNTGITLTGTNLPLRDFLSKAVPQGASFFIDRRIDPAIPVTVSFDNTSFLAGVETLLSEKLGLEIFILDNVIYIGPKKSAGTLMLLIRLNRQQLEKVDSALAGNLLKKSSLDIPYASTSRDILMKFAHQGKFQWSNLKRFPFDCWSDSKLPPLPLIDQISLVLVGFDCRLEIDKDQKEFKFLRCQRTETLKLFLPKNKLKNSDQSISASCQIEEEVSRPGFVCVSGPMEDLVQLESQTVKSQQNRYFNFTKGTVARPATVERKKKMSGTKKIISGEVKNTNLENLFRYLQKNLDVAFRLEESLSEKGISYKTQISCSFEKSDASDAAKKIAKELNIHFRWEENNICFY